MECKLFTQPQQGLVNNKSRSAAGVYKRAKESSHNRQSMNNVEIELLFNSFEAQAQNSRHVSLQNISRTIERNWEKEAYPL